LGYACRWRWLGKWDRNKESAHWEFDDFASNTTGIERLGVLRMDVDNLGQLFIRGFRWADKQVMGSLSRVATLSRQLDFFFSGHLMHLLRDDQRTQIIYAGGDDLFLIGSWDGLPHVARKIQQSFSRYAAENPDFTISGGMAMVHGKYPISHAAELAGEAEERAKGLVRRVEGKSLEKAAFCTLDTPIGWEDFSAVERLRGEIEQTFMVNRGVLGRLRHVVMAQQEYVRRKHSVGMDESSIRELLYWQRWRWLLVYHLHRVAKRHKEIEPQISAIRRAVLGNAIEGRKSDVSVIDWLQLPVRWAEFLHREAR
jgi:CRISPR-associated protein Csm1